MKAVITVVGKDTVGILAKVSGSDINMAVHVMHEDIFNSMHRI